MKPSHRFSPILQWNVIAIVMTAVIATGILSHVTLGFFKKNPPEGILIRMEALDRIIGNLDAALAAAKAFRAGPDAERHALIGRYIQKISGEMETLRQADPSGDRLRISEPLAVLAPAVRDIRIWLEEGWQGHGPNTPETLDAVISRASLAISETLPLRRNARTAAGSILSMQDQQLKRFVLTVNLLLLLVLCIASITIFLITRMQASLRRELEFQSELRSAEKSLQESEELYSKVIAAIPDIVVRTDTTGQVLFVNEVALKIGGYHPDDIVGKNLMEFIAPEDQAASVENFIRMFNGLLGPKEYSLVMKDGTKIPFEVNSDVLRSNDGSPYGTVSICRDISKRLEAEEALRESEKKYRQLFENANDAIFIAQDGKIKFPNPSAIELLGIENEVPEEIPFIGFIHPEDREKVLDIHLRRMSGEIRMPLNYVFRIVNAAGKEYTVQLNAVVITWKGHIATLNFVRDITDQLNLEASLRQAQKMEAIGTLAGGIAHDFNNLLMGIQGRISLMTFGLEPSHPFFDHLTCIEDCVKSASDLTRQLLGFARGGKYEITPACMNTILDQSIEMFGRTRKEVEIHKDYAENLWTVEVDRGQMHQVLLNLFVNAWQAMPDGGHLRIRSENCEIREDRVLSPQSVPGNYIKISVADTGAGMDENTRSRIFEPFFTTKEMGRGTGLGLASTYGIIRNHGGWITVDSRIGEGSTFSFYLPVSEKTVTPERPVSSEKTAEHRSVLLIDDEDIIIDVGAQLLEALGHMALVAKTGADALDIYRRNTGNIDLVILDMVMPATNGGKLVQQLKSINPNVRIILSSGYSIDGQAAEIMKQGCHGFIQKPYGITELSGAVSRAFECVGEKAP